MPRQGELNVSAGERTRRAFKETSLRSLAREIREWDDREVAIKVENRWGTAKRDKRRRPRVGDG